MGRCNFVEILKGRLNSVILDSIPIIDRIRFVYPVSDPSHPFFLPFLPFPFSSGIISFLL